jgi:signal transduction histidine kinase
MELIGRLTRFAARTRLTIRTVRFRLALLYAFVFTVSSAALLGVAIAIAFGLRARMSQSITGSIQSNQFASDFRAIVVVSVVALAVMAAGSIWLGFVIAGRTLKPLRAITTAVREISATNLDRRLALDGPDDELKELGDTFDGLLARLDASFASQRLFVANASHELRSPLARLKTLTQVALADPDATAGSLRAAHERVLASEQQLERLIDALLALASGEQALSRRLPLDLADLVRDALSVHSADIDRDRLQLNAALNPAVVIGDPELVGRLVENLVDNAIRHNATAGRIDVATTTTGSHAGLSVANSGAMISPEDVERLRQPFARLDRTGHGGGQGLGLSIVHAIATAHGATVSTQALPAGGLNVEVQFPGNLPCSGNGV